MMLLALLVLPADSAWGQYTKKNREKYLNKVEASDSTKNKGEVEDNPFTNKKEKHFGVQMGDSAKIKGKEDPIKYVMDFRFLELGDSLLPDSLRHWYDNLFLEVGAGAEQLIAPNDAYAFDPFTTVHVGLGINLGRYHTLRAVGEATVGYQKFKDLLYLRGEARLDHLFDVSSYFYGYDPTRLLGISTVLGGGLQYSTLRKSGKKDPKGPGAEAHIGLQLRFNTGPHGSFNVEPYCGIGPDRMDLSENNWRKSDLFYGVNLNYIYYFKNHLTRAARLRLIDASNEKNYLTKDSLLQSWAQPWFFEVAAGPVVLDIENLSLSETMGHNISLSIGKWFSPVIGLRATGSERMSVWNKHLEYHDRVLHEQEQGNHYLSFRADALFNPFGFTRNYNWNAPFGAYLTGAFELGWFSKTRTGTGLRCYSEAYSAALHLWARLGEGVQFFVEPRFVHNIYKIPYTNVDWNHQYSDNSYMINIGITSTGLSPKYRRQTEEDTEVPTLWTLGVGGGTNLIQTYRRYVDKDHFPFNVNGFAQYHFNNVSAMRLGLEYFVHSATDYTSFNDYDLVMQERYNVGPTARNGLWNHTYYLGMLSLGYSVNLTNLMNSHSLSRRFNFEIFGGPALAWFFGQTGNLSEKEMLREKHEAHSRIGIKQGAYVAANGGGKLSFRLSRNLGLYLSPQLFYIHNIDLQAIFITRTGLLETLDLGVQYKL